MPRGVTSMIRLAITTTARVIDGVLALPPIATAVDRFTTTKPRPGPDRA